MMTISIAMLFSVHQFKSTDSKVPYMIIYIKKTSNPSYNPVLYVVKPKFEYNFYGFVIFPINIHSDSIKET